MIPSPPLAVDEASSTNVDRRWMHEDFAVIILGGLILLVAWLGVSVRVAKEGNAAPTLSNAFKGKIAKFEAWTNRPSDAFYGKATDKPLTFNGPAIGVTYLALAIFLTALGVSQGENPLRFLLAYSVLFGLAIIANLLAAQAVIKQYNFEYVLWALFLGLIISNTVGVPRFLEPILMGEGLIKLGIVLLGAEVLLSKLLALGLPGICTSWIVTPIVLISTFWFGQRILKIASPSLNMVISADMSVCGVSAAIATGAACRAKKEEISYAIGVSLFFTAIMMVIQPFVIRWLGISPIVGAAWIGGTIDSTGAVVAAGAIVGKQAEEAGIASARDIETVAATIKMIQNVLIGVVALGVALYWSSRYSPVADPMSSRDESTAIRPGLSEIWRRFPKFILGFAGASLIFSSLPLWSDHGSIVAESITKDTTSPLRVWLFCLAFVAIGLQTDFRKLWPYLSGSRPLLLYLIGQCWNLLLSFLMAYLMFGILFAKQFSS